MSTPAASSYSQNLHLSEPSSGAGDYDRDLKQNLRIMDFVSKGKNNFAYSGLAVTAGSGLTVNWGSGSSRVAGTDYPSIGASSGSATDNTGDPNIHLANYAFVNNSGAVTMSTSLPTTAYAALAVVFTNSGSISAVADCRETGESHTVDGIHATATATANKLLALDSSSKLPASITGDAITVAGITITPPTAAGDFPFASAANLLSKLTMSANKKLFSNLAGNAPEWSQGFKIVQFTKALTDSSGQGVFTGVGFKPSSLIALSCIDASPTASWGISDPTTYAFSICSNRGNTPGNYEPRTCLVSLYTAGGDYIAQIVTYDPDGFTLNWTRNGTPSGTANVYVLCLR